MVSRCHSFSRFGFHLGNGFAGVCVHADSAQGDYLFQTSLWPAVFWSLEDRMSSTLREEPIPKPFGDNSHPWLVSMSSTLNFPTFGIFPLFIITPVSPLQALCSVLPRIVDMSSPPEMRSSCRRRLKDTMMASISGLVFGPDISLSSSNFWIFHTGLDLLFVFVNRCV